MLFRSPLIATCRIASLAQRVAAEGDLLDDAGKVFLLRGATWLTLSFLLCVAPAVAFLFGRKTGHLIEFASGLWTVAMYVLVGAVPHLLGWGTR